MTTIYLTHPRFVEHDLKGHPEHAGRIRAIWQALDAEGLSARLRRLDATFAAIPDLASVHEPEYLNLLAQVSRQFRDQTVLLNPDTYFTPASYDVAFLAAGGACAAVTEVLSGNARNGLAVVRPPGHHAIPDEAMGFCLLNNIAVAARFAQRHFNIRRVLIVDYDVHHGNGTEAIFYDDPSVLFISTHQSPLYPGTGALQHWGIGAGERTTINIPIPPGHGDQTYAAIFEQIIRRAARRFAPDLILVSAGFDAHWAERLSNVNMNLTISGFAHLSRELVRMADELCHGRIIFVTEGGYHLDALSYGVCGVARALLGDTPESVTDPLGAAPSQRTDAEELIRRVRDLHGLYD
jgi:acetoin utilization deacetylase AcuC-like enzyme